MFAPPICRRRWRNNALSFRQIDEDGGNPANIAASGASNRYSAMREQLWKRGRSFSCAALHATGRCPQRSNPS
jgi:hypothetical protein